MNTASTPLSYSSPYDSQYFESYSTPERHVQRLAAVSELFGVTAPPISTASILEIGCGTGTHLIAQALDLPEAQFTGLDSSAAQIQKAQETAQKVGCKNVRFNACDIRSPIELSEKFHYIICYGLYSWTGQTTRDAILQAANEFLTPDGILSLSYNALPGWSVRSGLHASLSHFDSPELSSSERIAKARSLLLTMKEMLSDAADLHEQRLVQEVERCLKRSDAFLLHELLNKETKGFYLHEVAAHAKSCGYNYIGDAQIYRMHRPALREDIPPLKSEIAKEFVSTTHYEIYFENLFPQAIRTSIFCRSAKSPLSSPDAAVLERLHLSSPLVPLKEPVDIHSDRAIEFGDHHQQTIEIKSKLQKAAFTLLHRHWPDTLPGEELYKLSCEMCGEEPHSTSAKIDFFRGLIRHLPVQYLEIYTEPLLAGATVEKLPEANALARYQVETQNWVTTYRHEVFLPNQLHVKLITLCDGEHTVEQMTKVVLDEYKAGKLQVHEEGSRVTDQQAVEKLLTEGVSLGMQELCEAALLRKK